MYGVYLLDSDILEIQRAKKAVDWKAYGFEVIGSGTDPALAENEIAALKPVLVIFGTTKPQSQGTCFIRLLRSAGIDCEVVILTTWWNQESMGDVYWRGGFDYLLKPLDHKTAGEVLTRFVRTRASMPLEKL